MRGRRRGALRRIGRAFTLVELLVVVSIIALLVSILLPSLARAREIARASVCASNLKGLGDAILMYANTYDGLLPMGYVADLDSTELYNALQPFSGSQVPWTWSQTTEAEHSMYRCPSSKAWFTTLNGWTVPAVSYVINQRVTPTDWPWPHIQPGDPDPVRVARSFGNRKNPDKDFKEPDKWLMLADGPVGAWPGYIRIGPQYTPTPESVWGPRTDHPVNDSGAGSRPIRYWHGDENTCNILFVDYHVGMGITPAMGLDNYYQDPPEKYQ